MRILAPLALLLVVSGCGILPSRGPDAGQQKAQCDQFAAQAIETTSLDDARRLAAQAANCYADLQRQRR